MLEHSQAGQEVWALDWEWSLPILILTVLFHVWSLRMVQTWVVARAAGLGRRHELEAVALLALTVVLITALHGCEAAAWAL